MYNAETFLRVKRVELGFRQVDVAELTGIPQPRLSRMERGIVRPNDDEFKALVEAYGLQETRA